MVAAANDCVDVISMSIGGYNGIAGYTWTDPDTGTAYKMKDVADFIAWKRAAQYVASKGVVLVVAAGNQATNVAKPAAITDMLNAWLGPDGYYFWGASREVPGTLPGVLTISATGPADRPASYTNYRLGRDRCQRSWRRFRAVSERGPDTLVVGHVPQRRHG